MKLSTTLLKEKINSLEHYYKQYPHANKIHKLKKIKSYLDNQEYKIAVVANMSSGKSTFINALFGEEVLPAFNHATTDCATFIYSKPNIDKKAMVYFSDKRMPIKIIDNIKEEIKQYAQKDSKCENKKYKNVEKIELYYPFKNIQTSSNEDFSIIFIDTPGPNNTEENYKQKHKDQTRSVLNNVDLALFMFDYTQLDANLSSDEQGLWNTIKKRHDKDKNFDVYFLLNKIDMAMSDNFKEIGRRKDEEYKNFKLENWFVHEQKAIDKLIKAGKAHGIKEPKIYPIASELQLFYRDKDVGDDDADKLGLFKKQNFRRVFNENWEEKFIEYIGISKLERDMNNYINESVKDKILLKIDLKLNSIKSEEEQYLNQRINGLKKPREEAEENLNKAMMFLKGKADNMEREFKEHSYEIQRNYINSIKTIVNENIDKELKKNINEATNRTIKFLELLLTEYSEADASSAAKNTPKDKIEDKLVKDEIRIAVTQKFNVELLEKNIQNFIKSILNDYKNNYLDMKIDIKNNYLKLSEEITTLFNDYKREFDKELKNTLKIKNINLDEDSLYNESIFDDDIKVPDSTIEYKHQSEKWDEGGSFSDRKKIQDEKHYIIISPSHIKRIFELSIDSMKRTYYDKEIKTYEDTIINFIKFYQRKFNDFKELKKQEIKQIEKDLENSKENLEIVLTRYDEFNKMKKEK